MSAVYLLLMMIQEIQTVPAEIAEAALTSYRANRESLGSRGLIRFRYTTGTLDQFDINDVKQTESIVNGEWQKGLSVDGVIAFDGKNIFVSKVHPLDVMVKRRVMTSKTSWKLDASSFMDLSDGSSTLHVHLDPDLEGKRLLYSSSIHKGTEPLFSDLYEFPLELANPNPPDYDPSGILEKALKSRGNYRLESAVETKDGMIRIEAIEEPDKNTLYKNTFLCDAKRSSIPVRTDWMFSFTPNDHISYRVWIQNDIRKTDLGWFPWKKIAIAFDSVKGKMNHARITEYEILDAKFGVAPDPSLFKIEFPEERSLVDSGRYLVLPSRRVWDLKSISSVALSRATKFTPNASPSPAPEMPGPQQRSFPWFTMAILIIGAILLISGSTILIRRWRNA